MEDLPNSFDVIVVGTGMPECIIAAALARAGKTVLHLDRNGYYGGDWASFNFDQLLEWIEKHTNPNEVTQPFLEANWLEQLNDDERLILCPKNIENNYSIIQKTFVKEEPEAVLDAPSAEPEVSSEESSDVLAASTAREGEKEKEGDTGSADAKTDISTKDSVEQVSVTVRKSDTSCQQEHAAANPNIPVDVISESSIPSIQIERCASNDFSDHEEDQQDSENKTDAGGDNLAQEEAIASTSGVDSRQRSSQIEWTLEYLRENRRKFNIDLAPKLLFARGSLVELLISSNIARYAEFQCVGRVLTCIDEHLVQVPCSRADVFSTKNVSVVEKRMLMKLLTFCMEFEKHPEEFRGFEGKPFIEFLRSRKVTSNIEHYVLHAIAMVDESCPTLEGLKATQRFMESLGRYGNSPFLWTCYGSAELPQCFCRLCAVFGGIYYLKRDVDAIILNSENKCVGVISNGRKISCQSIVLESSYAPVDYLPEAPPEFVSRAVYITESSVLPSERPQTTFLRLPPVSNVRNATTVLEFGSTSFTCPNNLYLVHMICKALAPTAEEDFRLSENELFKPLVSDDDKPIDEQVSKPKVLWCMYFRQKDTTVLDLNCHVPSAVFLTSSPGGEQDYEHSVKEAREIFEKICPGEEFLPRAPDPEDIILEEHANPGEDGNRDNTEHEAENLDAVTEAVASIEIQESSPNMSEAIPAAQDNFNDSQKDGTEENSDVNKNTD